MECMKGKTQCIVLERVSKMFRAKSEMEETHYIGENVNACRYFSWAFTWAVPFPTFA